jgi:hypothetical protein
VQSLFKKSVAAESVPHIHDGNLYAEIGGIGLFAKSGVNPCVSHVYHVNNTILVDWYNKMAKLNGVAPNRQIGKVLFNNDGNTYAGTTVIDMFIFATTASAGSVLSELIYSRDASLLAYYTGNATFPSI